MIDDKFIKTNTPVQKPAAIDRLREAWNENPLIVIGVVSGACMAVARIIDAVSSAQGRRAYAKQVNLRAKKRA